MRGTRAVPVLLVLASGCRGDEEAPTEDAVVYLATGVQLVDADGDGVVTLTTPIRMRSGDTLDCGGLTLAPTVATLDPADPNWSDPEIAVLLHDVDRATVRDCTIEGFDFALFAAGGGRHVFEQNTLETRNVGVTLLASDGNRIDGNTIRFGAYGVTIVRDADDNTVSGNTLEQTVIMAAHRLNPGVGDIGLAFFSQGVGAIVFDGPVDFVSVIDVVVDGELMQFPSQDNNVDDNVLEGNTVTLLLNEGGFTTGFYVAVRSNRTTVRDNSITGGTEGVHLPGFSDDDLLALPGRCAEDATRYCRGDGYPDCQLPGIDEASLGACLFQDEQGAPAGTCSDGAPCESSSDCGAQETCQRWVDVQSRLRVQYPTVEHNQISGAASAGIAAWSTRAAVLRGNTVSDGYIGISLAHYAVEDTTILGNSIRGNEIGMQVDPMTTDRVVGAVVTRNDFVDNALGLDGYLANASFDGNFWGHDTCPGFSEADRSGHMADCAPYAVSVADVVPDEAAPCPVESRPRDLDGTCAFDAPATVTATGGTEQSFEVAFGYTGDYLVEPFGLAPATTVADALPATGPMFQVPLEVPAGARHLRVHLLGEPGRIDDLDLYVFGPGCGDGVDVWTCPWVAPYLGISDETVDMGLPEPGEYVLGVDPYYVVGDPMPFDLSWWVVDDTQSTLVATAPSDTVAGTHGMVTVSWPGDLASGTWLGTIEHANEYGPLRSTVVELAVP